MMGAGVLKATGQAVSSLMARPKHWHHILVGMDLYHCTTNLVARHWGQIRFYSGKRLFIHPACKMGKGEWGRYREVLGGIGEKSGITGKD